jgi:hypothetical protein
MSAPEIEWGVGDETVPGDTERPQVAMARRRHRPGARLPDEQDGIPEPHPRQSRRREVAWEKCGTVRCRCFRYSGVWTVGKSMETSGADVSGEIANLRERGGDRPCTVVPLRAAGMRRRSMMPTLTAGARDGNLSEKERSVLLSALWVWRGQLGRVGSGGPIPGLGTEEGRKTVDEIARKLGGDPDTYFYGLGHSQRS